MGEPGYYSENDRRRQRAYAAFRGPVPLCGCGCGNPVKIGAFGIPRRFLNGHGSKVPEIAAQIGRKASITRGTLERNEEIKRRVGAGEKPATLAREYGVSAARIEQIADRQKYNARAAVYRAIGRTLAIPDACSRCAEEGYVEAHHEDYSKALEVVWLCRRCHTVADAERREREESKAAPPCEGAAG